MNIESIKEYVKSELGAMDWAHTKDVVEIGRKLADLEGADIEVVEVAAWFHDASKANVIEDHGKASAIMAEKFLKDKDHDSKFIEKVVHCVRTHEGPYLTVWGDKIPEKEMPRTKEAKVMFDADMIAQFKRLGIAKQLFNSFVKEGLNFSEGVEKAKKKMQAFNKAIYSEKAREIAKKDYDYVMDFFNGINLD